MFLSGAPLSVYRMQVIAADSSHFNDITLNWVVKVALAGKAGNTSRPSTVLAECGEVDRVT